MTKIQEINNPLSCLNKAADDEPIFVLRASDECAPEAIRDWVHWRFIFEKNKPGDAKLNEALALAEKMTEWRRLHPTKTETLGDA